MFTDEENPKFPKHPGAIRNYGELRRMFDGYDGGVRYADMLLGKIKMCIRDRPRRWWARPSWSWPT